MVYITSELFSPESGYDRHSPPTSTHTQAWNSTADAQLMAGLGKRKRRMDDDEEGSTLNTSQRSSPTSRGLLKLHSHTTAPDTNINRMYPVSVAASACHTSNRRPVKQMRRLNPKVSLSKMPSHLMDIEPDFAPNSPHPAKEHTHVGSDLRPCHACKTAPKRKRELENFMDCKRCDGRTCYICARECLGCRKATCKKCIVEVGEEGDPWCLECYSQQINT